jgi:phosphatidylglycerol:prolipoprotein diacylglycerol transferase
MLPVLYRFTFESPLATALLYLVALALVVASARNGWRNATGVDGKGQLIEPTPAQRQSQAIKYGLIGLGLAGFGLYYALPQLPIIGRGKGEGIPIHSYGLLIGAGFVSAVTVASWLAAREWPGALGRERRDQIFDLAFYVFIGAIIGSRVLFIIVNWKDYAAHPARIFDLGGGLVFYGGLIGATLVSIWYCKKHDIEFLRLADLAIPTVSLGQAFGRLGCFSAACCWGDITTKAHAPFAVTFPGAGVKDLFGGLGGTPSLAYSSQADAVNETRWVIEQTGEVFAQAQPGAVRIADWVQQHGHTLPVHPTQLYESLGQIILFMALLFLRNYRRFHGQIFALWLMCYAVLRTSVELFRGDLERGTIHGLLASGGFATLAEKVPTEAWYNISTSQFISMCMFSLGAWLMTKNLLAIRSHEPTAATSATA